MEETDWPNLVTMFFDRAQAKGDKPFLWKKTGADWHSTSWNEAAGSVAAIARALSSLGVEDGDRIALVSESRPEWPIADLAIMAAGAISVPAYVTNSVKDHLHVLTDSGARGIIVSTPALAKIVLQAAIDTPAVKFVITMDDSGLEQDPGVPLQGWQELIRLHKDSTEEIRTQSAALIREKTACLIYTSGTGGVPKGVMLSHGAILSNCAGAIELLSDIGLDDEVFLSFLPLSHSYEHTAGLFFPISIGAQIYYASGVDRLSADMAVAKPTIMTAVPRLYEVMHDRIRRGVKSAGGKKEALFERALALGRKRYENTDRLTLGERLTDAVLTLLVRRKVKAGFGGTLKALVSGGAPLNYDIGMFFTSLGIRILQGYGQTESAPCISCNPPRHFRIDSVGPPMKDVELRIADDGEILVRGEMVMQGYWENPDATAEVIQDGWLHTGDIGEVDPDGHLRITDRKKDIIVNSGGDNLSPQRVEGFLTLQPEIAQAMVYGDRRPHIVALVVPDAEFAESWAAAAGRQGGDLEALLEDESFRAVISAAIDRVNADLSVIEKVRRFVVTAQPFTIENSMMTPTLKIRRHVIRENYGNSLEALYGG
ncbi:MAG: long-chain fatty acid--CoA ligase [Rhodospirillaceae bacterium]|jgi:long-chain acyl-CoA synthetase|nr:long-chain fatty acid--CoA ligase [Rhodospirillaceae bacterium]